MAGKPYPKSAQLARNYKRYRRKVATPKQWAAIQTAKLIMKPCRVCGTLEGCALHHVVKRGNSWHAFGDDVADNLIPLCRGCHEDVHVFDRFACLAMLRSLTPTEYAYMIERGGPGYPEWAYGLPYRRGTVG